MKLSLLDALKQSEQPLRAYLERRKAEKEQDNDKELPVPQERARSIRMSGRES